ncbi:TetR/AcrR family transcriptional regulator [Streptomyces sp. NPDC056161]|uniref:TetR/AcrR family transcriptional regulator n=1 Tax=Streptomyces sp. NPDC056161 TaxID=3345732 RepID=UPI0035DEEC95
MVAGEREPGLRERKKARTRAELRRAAIALALEHGPSAVTVPDICAAAGVSPRTFFNYFDSKEEPLFAWDPWLSREATARLALRPADEDPLTALRRAMQETLPGVGTSGDWPARRKLLTTHPDLVGRLAQNLHHMEDLLAGVLAERLAVPPSSLYPQLAAGAAVSALRASFVAWDPDTGQSGLADLLDRSFDYFAAGLPVDAGQADRGEAEKISDGDVENR